MYIGYRGHVTKCAPESVRLASSHEQLAAEDWAEALNEVLIKAQPAPPRRPEEQHVPVPPRDAAPPPPERIDVAVGNQEPSAAVDDSAAGEAPCLLGVEEPAREDWSEYAIFEAARQQGD